ncbi:conserved unknown protein [Ectocarpus siliculosus]|uniref:Uncharacterized protein n=1 Tax=Ectocarpus siliculosus TaxID=2880 RepID=D8LDP0_ECTSI|nr:conserved unknown protein [Ectocarpus siliculosus]|eukprot:CBN78447.1 conserved unknown protein [Ectocarpus siliculosus]
MPAQIRDSSNPFFTTTNSRIGNSACQKHEYDAPPVFRKVPKVDRVAAGIDWSFMYTRNRVPEDKDARDELLKNFKHTSKKENPLYSTTNNDIGIKRPTGATFTFERRARQQGFSNSFNGLKFRDMGLNTNVTRSNIHDDLNPQFM